MNPGSREQETEGHGDALCRKQEACKSASNRLTNEDLQEEQTRPKKQQGIQGKRIEDSNKRQDITEGLMKIVLLLRKIRKKIKKEKKNQDTIVGWVILNMDLETDFYKRSTETWKYLHLY